MQWRIVALCAAAGLSGCVLTNGGSHVDVMVFGTTTKFAVDVSAPVQNGAIPELTVGYKRNEGVWMPLAPRSAAVSDDSADLVKELQDCTTDLGARIGSATEAAKICAEDILPAGRYVSVANESGSQAIDAYSVFASFGAKGAFYQSGSSGGLAQIFATGVAAQKLAQNQTLGLALSSNADETVKELVGTQETTPTQILADAAGVSETEAETILTNSVVAADDMRSRLNAAIVQNDCLSDPNNVSGLMSMNNADVTSALASASGDSAVFYRRVRNLDFDTLDDIIRNCP
ncbi:MAG: hypothetical protein AAFR65_14045 [Pseudomonadota bacterium]